MFQFSGARSDVGVRSIIIDHRLLRVRSYISFLTSCAYEESNLLPIRVAENLDFSKGLDVLSLLVSYVPWRIFKKL